MLEIQTDVYGRAFSIGNKSDIDEIQVRRFEQTGQYKKQESAVGIGIDAIQQEWLLKDLQHELTKREYFSS